MKKNFSVIGSLLYLVLGIIMIVFPKNISNILCYFIGSVIIIYGIVNITTYSKIIEKNSLSKVLLIIAIACILFGLFILAKPETFASIIPFVTGIYMLLLSISKLGEALDLRRQNYSKWWMVLLFFIELFVFSLILIFNPFSAIELTIEFIGLIFIINSLSDIWTYMVLKKNEK